MGPKNFEQKAFKFILRMDWSLNFNYYDSLAGATQVKWNKLNENIVASSHDGDIRLWDTRKGSSPFSIISAHVSKIYSIDWKYDNEHALLSCGQDSLLKIWDTNDTNFCQSSTTLANPAWRSRFTPFCDFVVSMPQVDKLYQ